MKIGLLNNLYGKYSHGGAETVVALMIKELQLAGHEVFLITTKPKEAPTENTQVKIYYLNSLFYNLNQLPLAIRAVWHITNLLAPVKYQAIKKIIINEKADLIISHNLMGLGFSAGLAIRKTGVRHEHFLHDIQLLHPSGLMIVGQETKIDSLSAKIYQALTRNFIGKPSKIISPSRWLLDLHIKHGFFLKAEPEIKPFTWPSTNSPVVPKQIKDGIINFLFIGQVEEQKGAFLLIETFKNLNRSDISLTIAARNDSPGLKKAKELASDDKRINILGPLSYEEVEKIKTKSDCVIIPSLCYENSPTVIYGAHANGLPVIASDIGGIPEIINSADVLFQAGSSSDLAEKINIMTKKLLA